MRVTPAGAEGKATWSTAYINDLADSAFAVIEPGGEKDDEGKTTPRSLRHFPHHNAEGDVDMPHLRNALSRIPQSSLSDALQAKAERHCRAHMEAMGMGEDALPHASLHRKDFTAHVKAASGDTDADRGVVEAIVAVFSNLDSQREIITPGAFTKSLSRKLPKGVWGHDWSQPVARTEEARELFPGDPRLPDGLKDLGGLYIKGRFNLETQRGREAYSDIAFGIVDEFSIGYRTVKARRVTEEGEEADDPEMGPWAMLMGGPPGIRYLDEVELYEWSPVLVGANPATELLTVKGAGSAALTELIAYSQAQMAAVVAEAKALHARRAKEGRTFSSANVAALEGYATDAETIATGIRSLLAAAKRPERDAEAAPKQRPADAADADAVAEAWRREQRATLQLRAARRRALSLSLSGVPA